MDLSGWLTWKTERIKILLVLALILSVAAAVAEEKPNVPDWKLKCADGSQVEFRKELAKGPVLISFWALWCKPCLKELPHIDKLGQEFQEQMTVLAVNIDSPQSVARVRPYLKSKGYKVKVPLDTSGDLMRMLQIGSVVPFVILYDSDGREVYRHVGYKEGDEKELYKHVATLLQGGDGADSEAESDETSSAPAGGDEG
jgi:thiol-disulfide isomerase/thioredoxin